MNVIPKLLSKTTLGAGSTIRHSDNPLFQLLTAVLFLACSASAFADVHYVDVSSTNATPPYTNWATAATNIQDAVDAAVAGDEIVVTNGTYASGGRATGGDSTNRVAVDKPLNVWSVNGPQSTTILGAYNTRCVYLTNGASLSGFTLTNGFAFRGGGVYCEPQTAVVSNCLISGNIASDPDSYYTLGIVEDGVGGGAYYGTLNNCTLSGNLTGYGGGAAYCTLNNCTLISNSAETGYYTRVVFGGAAYNCTLNNCTLTSNSALPGQYGDSGYGGGAFGCALNNCTLIGNSATIGGGADLSTLSNCTLRSNEALTGGGAFNCTLNNSTLTLNWVDSGYGGGTRNSTLSNCIVYGNISLHSPYANNYDGGALNYCCTTPKPTNGVGNITNAPLFVDTNGWADLRLQSNSPCINAGNNAFAPAGLDLDGNPRIAGGTVDIGAYEFQSPVSQISYAWLQQFGLSINSSIDTADPDGDAVDNYHEWLAGTNPTNPLSSPAQLTITPSGVPPSGIVLTWSTNAVGFMLQSTTNLLSSAAWVTNSSVPVVIAGQNTITNPITGAQKFYRLIQ